MKRIISRAVIGLVVMSLTLAGSLVHSPKASAGACLQNLTCDTQYFSGVGPATGQWATNWLDVIDGGVPASVKDLPSFLSFMANNLKCTTTDQPTSKLGVAQNDNKAVGTAFIILWQLGAPVKTPKNQACVRWSEWKNIVTQYDQAKLINYNFNVTNQVSTSVNGWFTTDFGGDIGFGHSNGGNGLSIIFWNPNGSGQAVFTIRHYCGNVTGVTGDNVVKLPPVPGGGGSGTPTPPPTPPTPTPTPPTPPPATPPPYGDLNQPE